MQTANCVANFSANCGSEAANSEECQSLIVFNGSRSTAEEQFQLLNCLPVSHSYGDANTTFVIDGVEKKLSRQEVDILVSADLRIKTRKRCILMPLMATHTSSGNMRRPLEERLNVLACFLSVPDWQAVGLEVETHFLKLDNGSAETGTTAYGPKIGPYSFDFASYALSVYEDLAMCFSTLKTAVLSNATKCHLKIVPLSVGQNIKTRFGDYLAPYVIPVYIIALQFACKAFLDSSWVQAIEFVDHSGGFMTPVVDLKGIRIMSGVMRDAFDFSSVTAMPAILLPCDAFCVLGSRDRNLASTMANNSNLRSIDLRKSTFTAWPSTKIEVGSIV